MSWRQSLRPGSFRGAPFKIQVGEGEGGRRGELHEFPERDQPYFEDLGRAARRYAIEAILVGADYMEARDRLLSACEAAGAGTLVHPFLGSLSVVAERFTWRESTEEGGAAFFSIDFVEAGAAIPAEPRADTAELSFLAADSLVADAPALLARDFSVAGMPAFVEQAGAGLVRDVAAVAGRAGTLLAGAGSALRSFEAGLVQLPSGALALVRAPLSLGQAVAGLIGSVSLLGTLPIARVNALRRILAAGFSFPPVFGSTPARSRQRRNQAAFTRLVVTIAAAEAVRTTALVRVNSYDEAAALRDVLADELDAAAVTLADAGDQQAASDLDGLRRAMVRDVTARGGSLARLYRYVPAVTEPVLATAHRLYGEPKRVVEEAEEIVSRNRIAHPGFVPGGRAIEVRTNG